MNGEIGVHNDAPLLNGKIGEDFGMGGAVTVKGHVDLGSSVGSPVVDAVCVAMKGVGADRKETVENGRTEGDDRTGNCVGDDAVVKRRENGALENGFSGANGHVLENESDVFKGTGVVVVVTGSDAEEHRENGVLENGDCGAGGVVEVIEVEVPEANGCDEKLEDVKEADVVDRKYDINRGAEDHSLSNGFAREESLSGSQDSKVEHVVVEHQNGRVGCYGIC
ncbi:hypothetical protein MLD38_024863 [Melastoma candidum]|uniref:Uncharacterized protein n=1 Tax=Melastoma candidum TaxID=119954 RepID=A0ACB9NV70_9MYRT|nr:hypothetical protein MLD38_024863 [Melastoma candidum]